MESQPQNPEFRNNPENLHLWSQHVKKSRLSILTKDKSKQMSDLHLLCLKRSELNALSIKIIP